MSFVIIWRDSGILLQLVIIIFIIKADIVTNYDIKSTLISIANCKDALNSLLRHNAIATSAMVADTRTVHKGLNNHPQ